MKKSLPWWKSHAQVPLRHPSLSLSSHARSSCSRHGTPIDVYFAVDLTAEFSLLDGGCGVEDREDFPVASRSSRKRPCSSMY